MMPVGCNLGTVKFIWVLNNHAKMADSGMVLGEMSEERGKMV